jgi:hypothetical protein
VNHIQAPIAPSHGTSASVHPNPAATSRHTAPATTAAATSAAIRRTSSASMCGHEQFSRNLSGVHITSPYR